MADEVDRAQQLEEAEREYALRNRPKYVAREYCAECEVKLEPHRIVFGKCKECAEYLERTGNQYGGR